MAGTASVALAVVLASTMLYAAASKLATPWNLKKTMEALSLSTVAWPVTWLVIAVEAAVGVGTAVGAPVQLPAIGLLTVFGLVGIWVRVRHVSARCSCFGLNNSKLGLRTTGRAALLVAGYVAYASLLPGPAEEAWIAPIVIFVLLGFGMSVWLRSVRKPLVNEP